jgi:hypothetical protein
MIHDLLNKFEPESDELLREISKHIDDEMLDWISTADYGSRADEHMVALRQVRDKGTFPLELHWCPMEVLELIRWSEPEDPEWKPGRAGEFGHWMRVFSCAAILRVEQEPYNYPYNDGCVDSTVIQLIFSLRALPVDLNSHAAKYFAWLLLRTDPEGRNDSVRVYGVALLWFVLHLSPSVPDATLIALSKWVVRRADELDWRPTAGGWSGLREMVLSCQKKSSWELLGSAFCDLNLSGRSSDLQVWVEVIGEQLAG